MFVRVSPMRTYLLQGIIHICKGLPLGDVADTWAYTNVWNQYPLGAHICHMIWYKYLQWITPWIYSFHMKWSFFKGFPPGYIASTWSDTNICKIFLLENVYTTWSDTNVYKGFLFRSVVYTLYGTMFFMISPLGSISATWAATNYTRGYLLGPYLKNG